MGKMRSIFWLVVFLTVITACSSSKKTSDADAPVVEAANTEAVTDDVPPPAEEEAPAPIADASGAEASPQADISDKKVSDEQQAQNAPAPEALSTDQTASNLEQPAAPSNQDMAAAAPASNPSSGEKVQYKVQQGDTLMKIAFENYGDLYQWKKIFEENQAKIPNPNALTVGAVLEFDKPTYDVSIERNGEKYLIKMGDTLGKISGEVYGTIRKWRVLWENNRALIKDPNKIFAGFYLYYVKEANQQTLTQSEVPSVTPPARSVAAAEGGEASAAAPVDGGAAAPTDVK